MLYAWAYKRAFAVLPTFKYLVLNRASGTLTIFDRTWSPAEWREQFNQMHFHAEEIAEAVAARQLRLRSRTRNVPRVRSALRARSRVRGSVAAIKISLVRVRHKDEITDLAGRTWVQPALDLV